MTDICKRYGLDVDGAINQLLDYKNSPAKQVRLFANALLRLVFAQGHGKNI